MRQPAKAGEAKPPAARFQMIVFNLVFGFFLVFAASRRFLAASSGVSCPPKSPRRHGIHMTSVMSLIRVATSNDIATCRFPFHCRL